MVLANRPVDAPGRLERRRKLVDFWSFVDEILNTFLFIILGLEILNVSGEDFALLPAIMGIILALAARLVSVGALTPLLPKAAGDRKSAIAILTWVGLRGGISLALILNLPDNEWRGALAAVCYVVVIFSIVVQGLLTPRIIASLYGTKLAAEPIPIGSPSSAP
jgi:CPA1 family monovalent cation:H+ antiporter